MTKGRAGQCSVLSSPFSLSPSHFFASYLHFPAEGPFFFSPGAPNPTIEIRGLPPPPSTSFPRGPHDTFDGVPPATSPSHSPSPFRSLRFHVSMFPVPQSPCASACACVCFCSCAANMTRVSWSWSEREEVGGEKGRRGGGGQVTGFRMNRVLFEWVCDTQQETRSTSIV